MTTAMLRPLATTSVARWLPRLLLLLALLVVLAPIRSPHVHGLAYTAGTVERVEYADRVCGSGNALGSYDPSTLRVGTRVGEALRVLSDEAECQSRRTQRLRVGLALLAGAAVIQVRSLRRHHSPDRTA